MSTARDTPGVWFAVDVGSVRVGIARSDPRGVLAVPVTTLARDARTGRDLAQLADLVAEYEAVVDPDGRQVELWFQETDAHEEPRQRFHVDVTVPPDQAQTRIDAAVAAGGTIVSTDRAPAWTVLADPEGNKVCVCTWQGRETD